MNIVQVLLVIYNVQCHATRLLYRHGAFPQGHGKCIHGHATGHP
jgi:hypothetical protein